MERVSEKFLKHIEGSKGLYEIRVEVSSDIYRVFCFFDEGRLVVMINGFQKKSQKTPKNEIDLAERLMKEYFDNKK
jgi:phage-related protein